jgi:succinate-acetate transporter protein
MESVILLLLSNIAHADTTTTVQTVGTTVGLAFFINAIVQIFAGVAQHPVASGIGLSAVSAFFSIIWFFVSGKFTAWQQKNAQNSAQENEQNFVDNQLPQNQQDNNDDNQGRKNLDGP